MLVGLWIVITFLLILYIRDMKTEILLKPILHEVALLGVAAAAEEGVEDFTLGDAVEDWATWLPAEVVVLLLPMVVVVVVVESWSEIYIPLWHTSIRSFALL